MKFNETRLNISLVMFKINYTISTLLGLSPCTIKIADRTANKIGLTPVLSYSRVGCAYNIVLIIFCIVTIMIGIPPLNDINYPNNSKTVKMITINLTVMGNVGAIVIISIYAIFQNVIVKIGNQLEEFDVRYGDRLIGNSDNYLADFKKYTPIIVLLLFWIGLVISTILAQDEIYIFNSGVWAACFGGFLSQYSLVIRDLKDRFEGLNNALVATAKYPILSENNCLFRGAVSGDRLIIKNLIMIKRARKSVYKITIQVCRFYSFPVLIVISYCCCNSVNSLYYCILTLIDAGENDVSGEIMIADAIFWALVTLYPIALLTTSVNGFYDEAEHTAGIIYDIMETYTANRDIESELKNFAVELLHKKITFNACGLFSLDCTLLHSIVGMIVTYLLILLQLKSGDD